MTSSTTTWATFDTKETADCVESCPIAGLQETLLVATYQLHQQPVAFEPSASTEPSDDNATNSQDTTTTHSTGSPPAGSRSGTFQVFACHKQEEDTVDVQQKQELTRSCGIFDIKWSAERVDHKAVVAAATSVGTLELLELKQDTQLLEPLCEASCEEFTDSMCLSLDWNNRVLNQQEPSVCVSHSDGKVSIWRVSSAQGFVLDREWQAHDLYGAPIEAWITAFDGHDPNVVFSGADDAILKRWDVRMGTSTPVSRSRFHSMGVCSIQSHPFNANLLAVGSYDEQVSLWDPRSLRTPVASFGTGGGVWRLKWHPKSSYQNLLLAACMHNGFQILDLTTSDESTDLSCAVRYDQHQSLAYGVDWWREDGSIESSSPVIASCSFYDHVFHVWSPDSLERRD